MSDVLVQQVRAFLESHLRQRALARDVTPDDRKVAAFTLRCATRLEICVIRRRYSSRKLIILRNSCSR